MTVLDLWLWSLFLEAEESESGRWIWMNFVLTSFLEVWLLGAENPAPCGGWSPPGIHCQSDAQPVSEA